MSPAANVNPTPRPPAVPDSPFNAALKELVGDACSCATLSEVGPGILYLVELPSRTLRFFSRDDADFPKAFFSLLESLETWEQLVLDSEREAYLQALEPETFQPQASFRAHANRRGETLPVKDFRQLLRDPQGTPVALVGRLVDDSFRSVAMDSLARRSWSEIAATMTRRFLHDFNNTIAGIYSLSELYAEPGVDPKSTAEAMGHIRDCSLRAQEITKKIRHLSALEPTQASYLDLGQLLREQESYLRALLPKGASVDYQIAEGQHPIHLDPNLFCQAILHLAGNACDAAGERVSIHISLHCEDAGTQRLAHIDFRDNGPGFKASELEQAATPFYTTKDPKKHPGLGLGIVSNFAETLGGSLAVSNAHPGAVARLSLPLLPQDAAEADPEPDRKAPAKAAPSEAEPLRPPRVLVYSWEDISRHPLLLALQKERWQASVRLDPGELLVELSQRGAEIDGVIVFKSPLDERAEPLLCELGRARDCRKVALIALGESVDGLPLSAKRNCGLVASGASKPSALLSKLSAFFH